ncbi:hypothetical protein C6495_18520 [Candidatus Poribacteria bacterium]|nr:MAG: hypothetical protein C6495_18520 [Candidatus Poribacteria bacterium]
MSSAFEVDDRFIRHIYILSIIFTVLIAGLLFWFERRAVPSFLIGSAISLSMLWSVEFVVRRLVRPGKSVRTKYLLGAIALGKYAVLGGCLYLLFKMEWRNDYALAGGIALTQVAIIFKAMGLIVSHFSNAKNEK